MRRGARSCQAALSKQCRLHAFADIAVTVGVVHESAAVILEDKKVEAEADPEVRRLTSRVVRPLVAPIIAGVAIYDAAIVVGWRAAYEDGDRPTTECSQK